MLARPVDVHGMRPSGDIAILPADKQITPSTCAAFARGFAFMANEDG
jgi:hypothetical protein